MFVLFLFLETASRWFPYIRLEIDGLSEAMDRLTDNHHRWHTGLQSSALSNMTPSIVVMHQRVHVTDIAILMHCFMFPCFSSQSSGDQCLRLRRPWQCYHGCLATSIWSWLCGWCQQLWINRALRTRIPKNKWWRCTEGGSRGMLGKNQWHQRATCHGFRSEVTSVTAIWLMLAC